ncbi:MAG: TIGR02680 family protein [Peptococcales bacterium]
MIIPRIFVEGEKKIKNSKWQLHRAGLLNFWYYDEEEFLFADGKLLLRGNNGSGKSVTMQSFIPVLLDGRKSPDRLDPFGSRARKMEDYLLGEKGVVDREERTGYLYLEYKREGWEQYLTTGIGLRAKRNSTMDFWGFVILDNRRISKDFFLYKKENSMGKTEKIPLTRIELENRLADGGKVVRTSKEYMHLVNKHIFGFENITDFEELIKLLIQLRSPKLSKDFKPTVIYEILNESLPGLSDDELRPLSETIENMDQTQQQIEQLVKEQKSLQRLCKQYNEYNQVILLEKAQGLINTHADLNRFYVNEKELKAKLINLEETKEKLIIHKSELLRESEVLQDEKGKLEKHAVFDMEKEKISLEQKLISEEIKYKTKEDSVNRQKSAELEFREKINSEEQKFVDLDSQISKKLADLDYDGEEAQFFNHTLAREEFFQKYQNGEFVFDLWKKETNDYQEKLAMILKAIEKLDKARVDYQEADKELAEARKKVDFNEIETKKWWELFSEEKEKILATIYKWREQTVELKLSDLDMQEISRVCQNLFEEYSSESLKNIIDQAYLAGFKQLEQELAVLQQQINDKKSLINAKEAEINEWQSKKDPEPLRHQDTIMARKELESKKIPYVPFYQAVEFKPQVTPEQRERLESAITQMGLLDALIVPEKHLKNIPQSDKVLVPKPQFFKHTLADLFDATPVEGSGITAETIMDVLQSILLEGSGDGEVVVREDGTYKIALLKGRAPREDVSRFIGQEARKRYRQEMIQKLLKELKELEEILAKLQASQEELEKRQKLLNQELGNFPLTNDVKTAYDSWQRLIFEGKILKNDVENKNNKVKKLLENLNTTQENLRDLIKDMSLPAQGEAYEKALQHMHFYKESLYELELKYKDYLNTGQTLKYYEANLVDTIERIDELKGEINVITDEIEKLELQIKNVQERLNLLGVDEVRQRINEVERRIKELPEDLLNTENKLTTHFNLIENTTSNLGQLKKKQQIYEKLCKHWEETFKAEFKLGLVKEGVQLNDSGNFLKMAKDIKEKLSFKENLSRDKLYERLNQIFYQEQSTLVEYRLTQEPLGEILVELDLEGWHEENQVIDYLIENLAAKSRRIQILLEYSGKKVSPFFVLEKLEDDIELHQTILNDKDRELYEEIIMNSVGRIIRARISRAEAWVGKIDRLMAERDTSSGLTFSLRWRPLTAEWEEELDTKELVELLKLDPKFLKPSDLDKITQHFRSKISRAKELMVEKGYGETFHQIIKEMLDYRQWFQFTLYYQRAGEKKKELTNNVFYTFSGGEKAMAMYIPLFSAAYSRYQEARKDAPYIISLDEAFAGVDENNIRDMFDLVEKLDFNYIMNSQALWGDYDTVSALSICELVRPQNAPYVSVVRYWWNGREKELVLPEQYGRELTEAAK